MLKSKLVVLVTDRGFLVPSLMVAAQLVGFGHLSQADIVIYTIDIDDRVLAYLKKKYENRIRFEALATRSFVPSQTVSFFANHVPKATLARLSLHGIIDKRYQDIVYIDGDIQVVQPITGLLDFSVPEGKILAGRGSAWLDRYAPDNKATPDGYLESLGGAAPEDYFNAGVLAFKRSTWEVEAPRALSFFMEHSDICIRHDQSALNAIFLGRVLHFAPAYNFHGAYASLFLQDIYSPAMIHFTGPNKPWNSQALPWGGQFIGKYRNFMKMHPELAGFLPVREHGPSLVALAKKTVASGLSKLEVDPARRAQRKAFLDYIREGSFPF
jgi:lipopolysaccharide biosynthesis glycosyltransferase